jgi:hypothetical protein
MFTTRNNLKRIEAARKVLSDPAEFLSACESLVVNCPVMSMQFLTNHTINRNAWLGRAASYVAVGSVETEVRVSWWKLSRAEQDRANAVASKFILAKVNEWKKENCRRQSGQLEFQF